MVGCGSPRLEPRSPQPSARPTLSNFGSFLPRPSQSDGARQGGMQAMIKTMTSPRMAATPMQQRSPVARQRSPMAQQRSPVTRSRSGIVPGTGTAVPPATLKNSMFTRGGVIRARDGYEVFYGVEKSEPRQAGKAREVKERDGFEEFYEISKQDAAHRMKNTAVEGQMQQQQAQLQSRLGSSCDVSLIEHPETPTIITRDMLVLSTRGNAESDSPSKAALLRQQSAPVGVQQFYVATPQASFAPPVTSPGSRKNTAACPQIAESEEPRLRRATAPAPQKGVQQFSLCGSALPAGVQAFSLATPVPSFAPPQVEKR